MFAFLPLVALLTTLGISTRYATPTVRIDSTRGLPDFEAQRAIYLEDSLTDVVELDSPDSVACSTAIDTVDDPGSDVSLLSACHVFDPSDWPWASVQAVNDSAADHVRALLADSAELPTESVRRLHEMESIVRPLSVLPPPAIVQVATRGNVTEPARATTCYLGLDCPE
jgi:hypothetical protein